MCKWRSVLNYLSGLVAGDGSLYYYEKNHEYFTYVYDNNRDFLERVGQLVSTTLKVSYTIIKPSKTKNYYRLQFTSKKIYLYLKKLLNERPKRPTKNFVRGLIDAEGSISMDKKKRVIFQVGVTNYGLALSVYHWLKKHGYRVTFVKSIDRRPNRKPVYKIYLRGWKNLERLMNELKPLHPKLKDKFLKFRNIKEGAPGTPP